MVLGGVNQFDSRNRLVQAENVVYAYDAENQRIGVNQTQFVINSQPALSQVLVQNENGQKTFYVYGLGLIGQEIDGEYTSYHFDFRGSTVALTDFSGQIVEQYQYSPYGLLLSGDSSKTLFLFNGMYGVMTDSNNLYYMRARFYSPEIKRFINQDILLGGIGDGQTLNRYVFVTGKPVLLIDPFGFGGHTPGGPYHRDEVKKKCTKDDTCPQLKAKMWIFQRMINSHQGWDNHLPPPRGGDRHKDEIGKLWRGWTRCQSLYYSKGCGGAPLFNPVPNPSENVKKNTVCFTGIAAYLIWNLKGCVFGPAGCAVDLMTPGF